MGAGGHRWHNGLGRVEEKFFRAPRGSLSRGLVRNLERSRRSEFGVEQEAGRDHRWHTVRVDGFSRTQHAYPRLSPLFTGEIAGTGIHRVWRASRAQVASEFVPLRVAIAG